MFIISLNVSLCIHWKNWHSPASTWLKWYVLPLRYVQLFALFNISPSAWWFHRSRISKLSRQVIKEGKDFILTCLLSQVISSVNLSISHSWCSSVWTVFTVLRFSNMTVDWVFRNWQGSSVGIMWYCFMVTLDKERLRKSLPYQRPSVGLFSHGFPLNFIIICN